MTKTPTPDRIWAVAEPDGDVYAQQTPYSMVGRPYPYLLSTPAREAAEELLEALEFIDDGLDDLGLGEGSLYRLHAKAAIAKAKGETQC